MPDEMHPTDAHLHAQNAPPAPVGDPSSGPGRQTPANRNQSGPAFLPSANSLLKTLLIRGLPGRLLVLTVAFVMLAEVLIFLPSISKFRRDWLKSRVETAEIASLAFLSPGSRWSSPDMALNDQLLEAAEVRGVVVLREGQRELILGPPPFDPDTTEVDLRKPSMWGDIGRSIACLVTPDDRLLRVRGAPRIASAEFIEVTISAAPLKRDMIAYSLRVLGLSLLVSAMTAGLVYLALFRMFVRPMQRIVAHIMRFRAAPNDETLAFVPSGRGDELGEAERALADMEREVRQALKQRERLVALGAAVAKIAHDLRNSLTTAQLVSDRLARVNDPAVQQVAPRLERAIARASGLAEAALQYGKAEEPAPNPRRFEIRPALEDAAAEALAGAENVAFVNAAPAGLEILMDPDHFHRILSNLIRNSAQALKVQEAAGANGREEPAKGPQKILAEVGREGGVLVISITDNGPGVPDSVRPRLFEAFNTAQRPGGSGLGLAIARELAQANGAVLSLERSSRAGATIALRAPAG